MSDPTRRHQPDDSQGEVSSPGKRAGPVRSDDNGYTQRRLIAERYILHARHGRVPENADIEVAADAPDASARAKPVAERLFADRYLLGTRIGSGRFGPIYGAEDTSVAERALNRHVAIQILWSELSKHEWLVERFQREFARLRSWRHDNIVSVLDFGRDADRLFCTTELLDGASLRSLVDELSPELLDNDDALAIIRSVGDALKYAHARKKIHGAVTLENVFVTSDMVVKLLDFAPIPIAPSAPLFADELKASLRNASPRDDVYGLACLAYELFSGDHPYGRSSADEARRCGLAAERCEGISRRTWRALRRGFATAAEKRTATVGELLIDLGIQGGERLRPTEPPIRAPARAGAGPPPLLRAQAPSTVFVWLVAVAAVAGLSYIGYGAFLGGASTEDPISAPAPFSQEPQVASPSQQPVAGSAIAEVGRSSGTLAAERDPDETSAARNPPAADDVAPTEVMFDESAGVPSAGEVDSATSLELGDNPESSVAPQEAGLEETASIGQDVADDSGAAPTTPTAIGFPEPSGFQFAEPNVTVSEGAAIASLVVRRIGSTIGESTFSWWTESDTALADEDYASFGTLVETFDDGEQSRTIHIPLVVDAIAERTERFRVALSYDRTPGDRAVVQAEVVILDDDF